MTWLSDVGVMFPIWHIYTVHVYGWSGLIAVSLMRSHFVCKWLAALQGVQSANIHQTYNISTPRPLNLEAWVPRIFSPYTHGDILIMCQWVNKFIYICKVYIQKQPYFLQICEDNNCTCMIGMWYWQHYLC